MHDLLYLSESKMEVLVPQLPNRIRRRLGFEAGVNTGVLSVKAKVANEGQPPLVGAIDDVVKMIENEHGTRWRTDYDLRAGDWIRFEEYFRYGNAWPGDEYHQPFVSGLTYFAAAGAPPFALIGSSVHVLDLRQPQPTPYLGLYYADALREFAQTVVQMPDEAVSELPPRPPGADDRTSDMDAVLHAVPWLRIHSDGMAETRLSGHARVIAVGITSYGYERSVLATPLYVEYLPR